MSLYKTNLLNIIFYNFFRISALTPKLTKQARIMVEDFILQLNDAMRIRLLNKFTVS